MLGKTLRFLLALLALAGVFHCSVLEPAFAAHETGAACLAGDGCDCCFVCCSFDHQLPLLYAVPFFPAMSLSDFAPLAHALRHDAPIRLIFHPPPAV